MAYHFVAIYSDYVEGKRVGWHYSSTDKLDISVIKRFMDEVELKIGKTQLGIHKLSTDSASWDSVVEKDSFFADVFMTDRKDEFIELISCEKELGAYDVAKFILTVLPTSHLKLQKLLYYAYAEFLHKTGKKLFKDPIVAFKYGPVVEDVFYKFRSHGSSLIDYKEDDTAFIYGAKTSATPSFVRITSSKDGIDAAKCIIDVIRDYFELDAGQLVDKTHIEGGPWDRAYEPGLNRKITDDLILKYHHLVR